MGIRYSTSIEVKFVCIRFVFEAFYILLKNWEGIRVLGSKVFVYIFDVLKIFKYFSEYFRFRILWDTLEYFGIALLWRIYHILFV